MTEEEASETQQQLKIRKAWNTYFQLAKKNLFNCLFRNYRGSCIFFTYHRDRAQWSPQQYFCLNEFLLQNVQTVWISFCISLTREDEHEAINSPNRSSLELGRFKIEYDVLTRKAMKNTAFSCERVVKPSALSPTFWSGLQFFQRLDVPPKARTPDGR